MIQIKDYTVNDCSTNNAYSIEMEHHSSVLYMIYQKVWIDSSTATEIFASVNTAVNSNVNTGEFSNAHWLTPEKRKKFLEMSEDVNRYKMYYWGDRMTSGWNHFHIFFPGANFTELQQFVSRNWNFMKNIMQQCPLYALYYPNTGFHKRHLWGCTSWPSRPRGPPNQPRGQTSVNRPQRTTVNAHRHCGKSCLTSSSVVTPHPRTHPLPRHLCQT